MLAGTGVGDVLNGDDGDDQIVGSDEGGNSDPNFDDATRFGDVINGDAGNDVIDALGGAIAVRIIWMVVVMLMSLTVVRR